MAISFYRDSCILWLYSYFNQTKLTSFQRQLNLYGFVRLTRGADTNGYYNEYFLRGRPFLTKHMRRTRVKGTKIKGASSPDQEPDFYAMVSKRFRVCIPPTVVSTVHILIMLVYTIIPSMLLASGGTICRIFDGRTSSPKAGAAYRLRRFLLLCFCGEPLSAVPIPWPGSSSFSGFFQRRDHMLFYPCCCCCCFKCGSIYEPQSTRFLVQTLCDFYDT